MNPYVTIARLLLQSERVLFITGAGV
ncbi:MAG: hypothetical protein QG660_1443, partial [Pseudomonadota bacterium]|nr:hypothetical protein [Pseudomonadota bacterium]